MDQFTGTDGTLMTAHTPAPTNPARKMWSAALTKTFEINSNKARAYDTVNNTACGNLIDFGISDVEISALVTSTGNTSAYPSGIILRATDSNNYLRIIITTTAAGPVPGASTSLLIEKVESGVVTDVYRTQVRYCAEIPYTIGLSTEYTITVRAVGSDIRISINASGKDILTHTFHAVTFNQTATKHGIIGSNRTGGTLSTRVDNFSVTLPSSITQLDPVVWLRVNDGAYQVSGDACADTNACAFLKDRSNRGHAGYQVRTSQHPIWLANQWGSEPAIQCQTSASSWMVVGTPFLNTSGCTLAWILASDIFTNINQSDLFRMMSTSGDERIALRNYNFDNHVYLMYRKDGDTEIATTIDDDGSWHLLVWSLDMTGATLSWTARLDKSTIDTRSSLVKWGGNGLYAGLGAGTIGEYSANARFHEFRLYDYAMTLAQMQAVEAEMWPA